ncbi:PREDICTED: aspartic proteinase CDR1-like [Prunus mume]|uniref:Aspartic proteinase CDR1-like n=1 Tax=Prunus mume TaxID=102107 RepID=A0ABM0NIA9_PRUMU|nr:PREDICTED: aspartic proteinase CDR1-like [Prunus mume]
MAERISPFFLCPLSTLLIAAPCGGLTIELIHRHSPQSPFYQPNLTHKQRIQTLAYQSITRAQYIKNMTKNQTFSYTPETVRVLVNTMLGLALYRVKIGLGTIPTSSPPYKSYNLVFDTGSDLTCLQCEYCRRHHCFAVEDEPFHVLVQLLTSFCDVMDILFARGLALKASVILREAICRPELCVLCCMGLGFGPKTFVNRIDSQGQSNGRFSYCLRRERTMGATSSFIRFGADIEQRPYLSVTELRRNNNMVLYYINLIGISVNGYRLNIPEQEFENSKRWMRRQHN